MGHTSTASARCVALVSLISLSRPVFCAGEKPPEPVPISIPPSQYWDGNDGPWSSFGVQIGTPPQSVRVLPSSSSSSLWVVLPQGCTLNDPVDCSSLRGFLFRSNASSTWSDRGLFRLPLYPEDALGYSGNADFGFDNITLAWQGQGGAVLDHQVVAGIATKNFYVGMLGLSPRPVNFTDFNHPEPSILGSLTDRKEIPSASWAYTAGAPYRARQPFGSLTLGGYDSARFKPNSLTFSFGPDTSRNLLVGVQAITTSGGNHLLPNGIVASVDSTVPHIWLPIEACQKFETSFGLVWDRATDLYLVNDTWHDALVARNISVTFKLSPSTTGGNTIDILLPYASFDLKFTSTRTNLTSRYFPLRRATNNTQYTLGRAFLQESYLIVDHTRSNFSISQTLFPDTNNATTHLIPILPPNSTSHSSSPNKTSKRHLYPPVIAGIVIGVSLMALICLTLYCIHRYPRKPHSDFPVEIAGAEIWEADATRVYVMSEARTLAEMDMYRGDGELRELGGASVRAELPGYRVAKVGATSTTSGNLDKIASRLSGGEVVAPLERERWEG